GRSAASFGAVRSSDHQAVAGSPAIAATRLATFSTDRANPPTWSSVSDVTNMPSRESRPKLGLNPTTPQNAAGRITEPFVWLPIANGTTPAATAAADPIDDPPDVRERFHGFRVGPGWAIASAGVTVFPTTTAPAARRFRTTSASLSAIRPAYSALPRSAGAPAVSKMSFTPTGTRMR